jgi:hypothetical protein
MFRFAVSLCLDAIMIYIDVKPEDTSDETIDIYKRFEYFFTETDKKA